MAWKVTNFPSGYREHHSMTSQIMSYWLEILSSPPPPHFLIITWSELIIHINWSGSDSMNPPVATQKCVDYYYYLRSGKISRSFLMRRDYHTSSDGKNQKNSFRLKSGPPVLIAKIHLRQDMISLLSSNLQIWWGWSKVFSVNHNHNHLIPSVMLNIMPNITWR